MVGEATGAPRHDPRESRAARPPLRRTSTRSPRAAGRPGSHVARMTARRAPRGRPGARRRPPGERVVVPGGAVHLEDQPLLAASGSPGRPAAGDDQRLVDIGVCEAASSRSSSATSSSTLWSAPGPWRSARRAAAAAARPSRSTAASQLAHVHAPLPLRRPHGPADDARYPRRAARSSSVRAGAGDRDAPMTSAVARRRAAASGEPRAPARSGGAPTTVTVVGVPPPR